MAKTTLASSGITFFFGNECTWCHKMMPNLDEAERQTGVKVTRREVWHNEANAKLLQEADKGKCGGVPFLINAKSGKWLCGFSEVDAIVALLLGK